MTARAPSHGPSIRPIRGTIQRYDWGSTEAIAELTGATPDGTPWAELWLGDHPAGPATLPDEQGRPLEARLPFLFKLLAAASPLSLQVHPTRAQAEAGYAREQAAGISLDAPNRTYKDRNHKPELLCALTPFRALCGFRAPADSAADLAALGIAALEPVVDALRAARLGEAFRWLLGCEPGLGTVISEATVAARGATDAWTAAIASAHPGDIGVVTALLLNRVELAPGDGLYLDAGTLHAYLSGTAVELMACSDNVVRGGLTSKHIDRRELLEIVALRPEAPTIVTPERVDDITTAWVTPATEFRLWRLDPTDQPHDIEVFGPEILVCLGGHAQVGPLRLDRGDAAVVDPDSGAYAITGAGVVYRATTG